MNVCINLFIYDLGDAKVSQTVDTKAVFETTAASNVATYRALSTATKEQPSVYDTADCVVQKADTAVYQALSDSTKDQPSTYETVTQRTNTALYQALSDSTRDPKPSLYTKVKK